jgi:hypothetical protein
MECTVVTGWGLLCRRLPYQVNETITVNDSHIVLVVVVADNVPKDSSKILVV